MAEKSKDQKMFMLSIIDDEVGLVIEMHKNKVSLPEMLGYLEMAKESLLEGNASFDIIGRRKKGNNGPIPPGEREQ